MLAGVLCGFVKEDRIISLIRRRDTGAEAENGSSVLPEEGANS